MSANKTFELNLYGKKYTVSCIKTSYSSNKSLAIYLEDVSNGETVAVITVNLPDSIPDNSKFAFVDTNNCPWACKFIEDNKLGTATGVYGYSGYCSYPEYLFDTTKFQCYEGE